MAAHDEQAVIAAKVHNALALDYPRELLEVIVACDGCTDETAMHARAPGAALVLELARGGKIRAQDAAVEKARGEIVAFSDANALWSPTRPRSWFARSRIPGRLRLRPGPLRPCDRRRRFVPVDEGAQMDASAQSDAGARADARAPKLEGVYWRYEMFVRALESRLSSITAGNGAIYATRRALHCG